jgi:hypothetical protein
MRAWPELERAPLAGAQFADLVVDSDANRPPHALPVVVSVSLPSASVTRIGVPRNCIANDSPPSCGGSRGSKYRTPSRIWVPA